MQAQVTINSDVIIHQKGSES